jgi:hypothetical protein
VLSRMKMHVVTTVIDLSVNAFTGMKCTMAGISGELVNKIRDFRLQPRCR